MRFTGAILDLDGTLVDSLPGIAAAVNHGMAALGLEAHSRAAVGGMVGEGVKVLCAKALPEDRMDLHAELLRHVWAYYDAHLLDQTDFFPGVPELIGELDDRGVKLAVLSNKPDELTRRTIDELGAGPRFVHVRGEREGVPRKPDPQSTLELLELMGLVQRQVVYVGDTPIDMQTAKAAGLTSVAVTWGFRSREILEATGPDHVVDAPGEILKLLTG